MTEQRHVALGAYYTGTTAERTGFSPTIAPTWWWDTTTSSLWIHNGASWSEWGSGGGTFLGLSDTPSSYSGQAGMAVRVNGGETALEFFDPATQAELDTHAADVDAHIGASYYAALAGTYGSPDVGNEYVTAIDAPTTPAASRAVRLDASGHLNMPLGGAIYVQANAAALYRARAGGAGSYPTFEGQMCRNTISSPGAVQQNDVLLQMTGGGWDGTIWSEARGYFQFQAIENWSSGARGTFARLGLTPTGGTSVSAYHEFYPTLNYIISSSATYAYTAWKATGGQTWGAGLVGHATTFRLFDISNTKFPLQVEANAPTSSLYVFASGDVTMTYKSRVRATQSSGQSIPNATWTKAQFDTEDWDVQGEYDAVINYRFQPNEEGYFRISTAIMYTSTSGWAAGEQAILAIRKNGVLYAQLDRWIADTATTRYVHLGGVTAVYFNGSTDYVEVWTYQNNGAAVTLYNVAGYNYLDIERIG